MDRTKLYTLILFFVTLVVSALILVTVDNEWHQERQSEQAFILNSQGSAIETTINRSLASSEILASWVTSNQGDISKFETFATTVIGSLGGITNLQLAPDGIVKHITPLEGHQAAIGHNILKDDERRKEALLAVASAQMTLAGPFTLVQGGIAIIGRKPVFLDKINPQTGAIDPNERYFWGYASALIYLDEALQKTNLTSLLRQGYYYQLWRYHPDSGEKQIFARNSATTIFERSSHIIRLPNSIWHLNIQPIVALNNNHQLLTMAALLFITALLICSSFFQLMHSPSSLKKQIKKLKQQRLTDQEALRHQQKQTSLYQSITDDSSNAILICDINGHIRYVNKRLIQQSGYSAAEIIGKTPNLFRSPQTPLTQHKSLWHDVLNGNCWQGTLCNRHKSGSLYWIDLTINPVLDDDGQVIELIATSTPALSQAQQATTHDAETTS